MSNDSQPMHMPRMYEKQQAYSIRGLPRLWQQAVPEGQQPRTRMYRLERHGPEMEYV